MKRTELLEHVRANLLTLAGMMRDQLDRQGYYRTRFACQSKIIELYRAG